MWGWRFGEIGLGLGMGFTFISVIEPASSLSAMLG